MNCALHVFCLLITIDIVSNVASYRTKRQFNNNTCILPRYPDNGKYDVINGNGRPGDKIDVHTIIEFSCNPDYKLTTVSSFIICNREYDSRKIPECARHCPPLFSSATTILKCRNRNNEEISCADATDGSYMMYQCIPFYEALGYRKNILCVEGSWNYPKPVCSPVCGRKATDPTAIYGGVATKLYEYPWVVAVYIKKDEEYINNCGGTLVTRRIVLTAAHCVTNDYADLLPIDLLMIGAGKYYNKYKDPRDDKAQYLQPLKLIVNGGYRASDQNYYGDIALIITEELVTLSLIVLPVCINDVDNIDLNVGIEGEIAGWGLKEDGNASDILRKLIIPYKYPLLCSKELPSEFAQKYYTVDKMCAGFHNKSISVCKGDSGSGLVFRNPEDGRYYIHGIVSLSPWLMGNCNIQQNALYTRVAFHYKFVYRELARNYVEECKLPPHPNNGKWIVEHDPEKTPGDIVLSNTVMKITCQPGYKLSSQNNTIKCDSSINMPTCDISGGCSAVNSSRFMECLCINGTDNVQKTVCTPVCGRKSPDLTPQIAEPISGVTKDPWVVALYKKRDEEFTYICSGTLISRKVVLTAAHCVTSEDGKTLSAEKLRVGANKYVSRYNDPREYAAQYLQVSRIIVNNQYRGHIRYYYGDIALIVGNNMFSLNAWLLPACIKDVEKIKLHVGDIGEVSGWGRCDQTQISLVLQNQRVPYIDPVICSRELPQDFADKYDTADKMCLGIFNATSGFCPGHGGSGLVFKNPSDQRYYIHGIVSVTPWSHQEKVLQKNALFTKVAFFMDFIREELAKIDESSSDQL